MGRFRFNGLAEASAADTPIRAWTSVGAAQVDQYGRAKRNGARSNLMTPSGVTLRAGLRPVYLAPLDYGDERATGRLRLGYRLAPRSKAW